MPDRIARRLFDFQCKCGMLDEDKRKLYEYAYSLLVSRTMVYILITVAGILLGNIKEMIIFLLAFVPLRQYAGGLHLKKAGRCIATSGIMVCTAGQYIKRYSAVAVVTLIVWAVAVCTIFVLAPVECSNKKLDLTEQKVYRKCSRILLGTECVLTVPIFLMGYIWILKGIILAQAVLAVSLVLGWIKENFF